MRTVPLQQICDIQIGKTPSRSVPEYWGGDLPWVTIGDFATGRIITNTKERITRIGAAKSGSKRIPRGTLLLSFKLSLGKRTISGCDLFTNEAIAALHILDLDVADRDYLYWALGAIDYDRLVDRAAKGKTLNKSKLKLLPIPLPPLAEQKRIARILDAADALRAERRKALAQLDALLQSTFLDAFGDPVTNPMGWEVKPLMDLGIVQTGATPPSKLEGMFGGEIPFVTPSDLKETWVEASRTVTSVGAAKSRIASKGATLVCCIGATVGKMGKVSEASAFNQQINAVSWGGCIADLFGLEMMRFFKPKLAHDAASTTLPILKKSRFEKILLPVPPLDKQQHFVAIVESVERQKASQRAHYAELDGLFTALQSRAFRGDL